VRARLTRKSAGTAAASLTLFFTCGYIAGHANASAERAVASPPPGNVGAYQEPAPKSPSEQHASNFVNQLLRERGATKRVSIRDLRTGVVLAARADTSRAGGSAESSTGSSVLPPVNVHGARGTVVKADELPRPDPGPTERAGVPAPGDQAVPGLLLGLVVAAALAAVGVVLEVSDRRQRNA
jgi:hypothetical protein